MEGTASWFKSLYFSQNKSASSNNNVDNPVNTISNTNMISVTKTVALAACLLSFFAVTHGAKDGLLLRKKLFTAADSTRIQSINRQLSLSGSDVQNAFRELLDTSNQSIMKWDSMSLSMSMSYNGRLSTTVTPTIRLSTTVPPTIDAHTLSSPSVVLMEPPMTRENSVVVVTNIPSTGEEKTQPNVSRAGAWLTQGAMVGIGMAAVAVAAVAALLVQKHRTQQSSSVA